MKVYLVEKDYGYDGMEVLGVFSSVEKAHDFVINTGELAHSRHYQNPDNYFFGPISEEMFAQATGYSPPENGIWGWWYVCKEFNANKKKNWAPKYITELYIYELDLDPTE